MAEESRAEKAMRILREKKWDLRMDLTKQLWLVQSNRREDGFKYIRSRPAGDAPIGPVVTGHTPEDAILEAFKAVTA